jgi:glycosyltransferase involved in cell wall biosynthesis
MNIKTNNFSNKITTFYNSFLNSNLIKQLDYYSNRKEFEQNNFLSGNSLNNVNTPLKIKEKPEILFISSYPSRECGIATYCQDLVHVIEEKYINTFSVKVCALEENDLRQHYSHEVKYILKAKKIGEYELLAARINADENIVMVFIQHEFGLFGGKCGEYLVYFLKLLKKPVILTFHTILPNPDSKRKEVVKALDTLSENIVVMTNHAAQLLDEFYGISKDKITVIAHGTHLISHVDKKSKINLKNRLVLSTFGLINSGKSVETALDALPKIIKEFPNVIYLIIGKTHPEVVKHEGEKYRNFLNDKIIELGIQEHVLLIDKYLSLSELLNYLQRTDIYLFTSKDKYQAVSGTFSYALSCACPIISTPIPQALELLDGAGLIVDFEDATQLADATIKLLSNKPLLQEMKMNAIHRVSPTAWQNSALAHMDLIQKYSSKGKLNLTYRIPPISLKHIKRMTTEFGMIQFSKIDVPDIDSGYTIDDNARALITLIKHYEITKDEEYLNLIEIYLNFICFCQQKDGTFLNYVDESEQFMDRNTDENLEDSNGRAIWALGEFIALGKLFDHHLVEKAESAIYRSIPIIQNYRSPRAIAFCIKGLCKLNSDKDIRELKQLIGELADDLVSKYKQVASEDWLWFEDYLTYANSVLPEALLEAYLATGCENYKEVAVSSFHFLLNIIFPENQIKVISNQGWHMKGETPNTFGEQAIDVAYTILALSLFYDTLDENHYLDKLQKAFNWFLGENHLRQIIYNPATGGCYDGLEEMQTNLNQGAESTLSYALSRLAITKYIDKNKAKIIFNKMETSESQISYA